MLPCKILELGCQSWNYFAWIYENLGNFDALILLLSFGDLGELLTSSLHNQGQLKYEPFAGAFNLVQNYHGSIMPFLA